MRVPPPNSNLGSRVTDLRDSFHLPFSDLYSKSDILPRSSWLKSGCRHVWLLLWNELSAYETCTHAFKIAECCVPDQPSTSTFDRPQWAADRSGFPLFSGTFTKLELDKKTFVVHFWKMWIQRTHSRIDLSCRYEWSAETGECGCGYFLPSAVVSFSKWVAKILIHLCDAGRTADQRVPNCNSINFVFVTVFSLPQNRSGGHVAPTSLIGGAEIWLTSHSRPGTPGPVKTTK